MEVFFVTPRINDYKRNGQGGGKAVGPNGTTTLAGQARVFACGKTIQALR